MRLSGLFADTSTTRIHAVPPAPITVTVRKGRRKQIYPLRPRRQIAATRLLDSSRLSHRLIIRYDNCNLHVRFNVRASELRSDPKSPPFLGGENSTDNYGTCTLANAQSHCPLRLRRGNGQMDSFVSLIIERVHASRCVTNVRTRWHSEASSCPSVPGIARAPYLRIRFRIPPQKSIVYLPRHLDNLFLFSCSLPLDSYGVRARREQPAGRLARRNFNGGHQWGTPWQFRPLMWK